MLMKTTDMHNLPRIKIEEFLCFEHDVWVTINVLEAFHESRYEQIRFLSPEIFICKILFHAKSVKEISVLLQTLKKINYKYFDDIIDLSPFIIVNRLNLESCLCDISEFIRILHNHFVEKSQNVFTSQEFLNLFDLNALLSKIYSTSDTWTLNDFLKILLDVTNENEKILNQINNLEHNFLINLINNETAFLFSIVELIETLKRAKYKQLDKIIEMINVKKIFTTPNSYNIHEFCKDMKAIGYNIIDDKIIMKSNNAQI